MITPELYRELDAIRGQVRNAWTVADLLKTCDPDDRETVNDAGALIAGQLAGAFDRLEMLLQADVRRLPGAPEEGAA